jgi:hypothetical protein
MVRLSSAVLLIFTFCAITQAQLTPFAMWQKRGPTDPCAQGSPALGTVCTGGAIYAGEFSGGKYMVTPGGCTNSATPTCNGSTDTVTKIWRGSTGSNVTIPGLETLASNSTKSTQRGSETTPIITAHSSISSNSAAHYCENMSFGGYSDWYLPSKSELAYLLCKADASSYNSLHPPEEPNCTGYGGKTSELLGFAPQGYWSSSVKDADIVWVHYFDTGWQGEANKSWGFYLRCIRRFETVDRTTPTYVTTSNSVSWLPNSTTPSGVRVNKPGSLAVGDLMVVFIGLDIIEDVTPPSGWTYHHGGHMPMTHGTWGDFGNNVLTKVATADDVAASFFQFNFPTAGDDHDARITVYRNVDTNNPIADVTTNLGSGSTATFLSVISDTPNSLLVGLTGSFDGTGSNPSGFTSRYYAWTTRTSDRSQVTVGSSGNFTSTASQGWFSILMSIRGAPL